MTPEENYSLTTAFDNNCPITTTSVYVPKSSNSYRVRLKIPESSSSILWSIYSFRRFNILVDNPTKRNQIIAFFENIQHQHWKNIRNSDLTDAELKYSKTVAFLEELDEGNSEITYKPMYGGEEVTGDFYLTDVGDFSFTIKFWRGKSFHCTISDIANDDVKFYDPRGNYKSQY